MVVTDPPYNVAYTGETKEQLTIANDNMSEADFKDFLGKAFDAMNAVLKLGGAFYIWHSSSTVEAFLSACKEAGLTVHQTLIWVKNVFVLSRQDYHWKHEPCLYGWKDGAGHYFTSDRTQATVYEDIPLEDVKKLKKEQLVAILTDILGDKTKTTVIHEDKPLRSAEHPTMKPVKLIAELVRNSSKPGETVFDPFGGSGSTLIACEQLGRCCYTIEFEPKYCDVIVKRWENLTGRKAACLKK